MSTEFAWVIEVVGSSPPEYLCGVDECLFGLTVDNHKAIRFARKEDARAVLNGVQHLSQSPLRNMLMDTVEHGWDI